MNSIKKYAVIVAGGRGTRMGSTVPKQFLPLNGKPLLCYAIEAFVHAIPDVKLVLVVPADELKSAQIVLRSYMSNVHVKIVPGGETRFHSVQHGLKEVTDDGIVFVHDGARPLLSADLIQRCLVQTIEKGSAIPAIPVTDSMRITDGNSSKPVDRERMCIIQTPQTFKTGIVLPAFQQEYKPEFTDEATVVEANGGSVCLIDGARDNIKVTTPEDMSIAEVLLKVTHARK